MRYYYNPNLKSTVSTRSTAVMGAVGFHEITEDEYLKLGGEVISEPVSTHEKVKVDFNPEVVEQEEDSAPVVEDDDDDFLDSLIEATAPKPVESESVALKLDESVAEQEEEAASNSFTSIRELREHADSTREARVTKGKAHGVYAYEDTSWVKIGDL